MTGEPIVETNGKARSDPDPTVLAAGRLVSLRFVRAALRRRRRVWLGLAVAGLAVGLGFHLVVPRKYTAVSTLYLADPANVSDPAVSTNDVAMVDTEAVVKRAAVLLGEPNLTMKSLLGKVPATAVSNNVLTISVSGPSPAEAVRRANAVATAFLAFRSEQYGAQNVSVVKAETQQIDKLQTQISGWDTQIAALGSNAQSQQLTNLLNDRATATDTIATLQQSIEQANADALSVAQGSRVITGGTLVEVSWARLLFLDGLSGLVAGLSLGLILVVAAAVLSDRLRRREDIVAVAGAPVDLSLSRVGWRKLISRRSLTSMASAPAPELQVLVQYLNDGLRIRDSRPTGLVVALDELETPAAALAALAGRLSTAGSRVALVDATLSRVLAQAYRAPSIGTSSVVIGGAPVTLVVPPKPWEPDPEDLWESARGELANIDKVLVLATVHPASGAWHVQRWANDAVVTVSAGKRTAQQVLAAMELLEAADISVSSMVLLNADVDDDSVGLADPRPAIAVRRMGPLRTAPAMLT